MSEKYISIQQAAKVSGRSIQTIRRCIKSKKLKFKKKQTPQGFNYSISEDSLYTTFNLQVASKKVESFEEVKEAVKVEEKKTEKLVLDAEDFRSFAMTMERLVSQHAEERQSFLRLVNTLQEKIFVMENQINLLKAPASKRWYQVWK